MKRNKQRDNYGLSLHSKQKRLFILATPIFASFLVIFGAIYYFLNSNQANALVTKVIYISAGSYHSIAVNSNGDLYSWGWNGQGQLGNGTNTDSNVPLPVRAAGTPMAGKKIVHVSTGGNFYKGSSLALSSEGKVYSWGANDQGQLGNGTATNSNLPVEVKTEGTPMAGKKIIQTAIGVTHSMALDSEGKVYSWGENVNGLLGTGDAIPTLSPVLVRTGGTPMEGKKIVQISAGGAHSMALDSEGNIYAWGWGGEGQLGNGENNNSNVPILVKKEGTGLEGKTIKKVMAGGMFSMVLTSDGSLYSWGKNNYGQIGDGTTNNYNLAVAVKTEGTPMAGKTVVDFSISNEHTVALTSDGQIYAWGRNESGQLGDGTNTASTLPVAVRTVGTPFAGKKAVQVVAGGWEGAHSLALGTDGTVYSWGRNLNGQLGDQTTNDTTIVTFAKINFNSSPTPPLKAMAISEESSAEVRWSTPIFNGTFTISDYVIQYRETGTEAWSEVTTSGSNTSKQITGLTNEKVYQFRVAAKTNVGVGDYSSIVLAMPHKKPTITSVTPVIGPTEGNQEVTINGTDFALKTNKLNQVSACANCSIALSMDGKVFSWGWNQNGDLGNGNSSDVNIPVAVKTEGTPMKSKTISQISSGGIHNLALSMDGKVYAWGNNFYGQLGNGTNANSTVPVKVSIIGGLPTNKALKVEVGSNHSIVVTTNGEVYAWGKNIDGQLGNGMNVGSFSTPILVKTESPSTFTSSNVKATFDNLSATDVTLVDRTKITAKTPAHNVGLVDVSVDLGDGDDIYKATKVSSYTYAKVPSKPINLIITPLENGIQTNWDQPLDDGGNPITGYTLEYSEDNGLTWQTASQTIIGTNYAVSTPTVDPAKKYVFRVAASNIVGRGPYSDTVEGQVRYITLDAPNSVDIDVTPANGARMSSNLTQVNTKTNSPSGHKLALSMDGAEQKLLNRSHFISPTSGTFASPIILNGSSWGYRVASVGGFGSGGSVELNVVTSAHKWAGVPVKATPHVIKTKNTANTTLEQTTVYYGASVDADQRSGSYKATVLYTAINN